MTDIPPGSICRVIKENTTHLPHHIVLGSLVKVIKACPTAVAAQLVLGDYKPESYEQYPHADRKNYTWAIDNNCLEVIGGDAT